MAQPQEDSSGPEPSGLTASGAPVVPVIYGNGYVSYVVGILMVVYIFNFMDRQILSILMQPIKMEMQLSDTELGFLSGVAFALFYATLGIPIARLADQYSRVNLITVCLSIWSFMTLLSGVSSNFLQLLGARIGVGIGEAGAGPASHSLIADYVPLRNRATALGVFALGVPIGLMIGFLAGGWLEQLYGWRAAFLVAGGPGLILAVILRLTVKEPKRGHSQTRAVEECFAQPSIKQVVKHMFGIRTYVFLCLAVAVQGLAGYGLLQWVPSFLARSHHMASSDIGFWLAMMIGSGAGIGASGGGYIADRLSTRHMGWLLWVPGLGALFSALFSFGILLSDSLVAVMIYIFLYAISSAVYLGPSFSVTQTLSPVRMRAIASAMLLFSINLVGLGMGPQIVGILSDLMLPAFDAESLRYAILIISLTYIPGCALFWISGRAAQVDFLRAARAET